MTIQGVQLEASFRRPKEVKWRNYQDGPNRFIECLGALGDVSYIVVSAGSLARRYRKLAGSIRTLQPSDKKKILDLCSGQGHYSVWFLSRRADLSLLDDFRSIDRLYGQSLPLLPNPLSWASENDPYLRERLEAFLASMIGHPFLSAYAFAHDAEFLIGLRES